MFSLLKNLSEGQRLRQPAQCPDTYYKVMNDCWAWDPSRRPMFNLLAFTMAALFVRDSGLTVHVQDKDGEARIAEGEVCWVHACLCVSAS